MTLFHFDDELKGVVIIRNWPKKWTLIDARDELVTDVFNVSCLFSWSPSTVGSLLCLNSTRNSRWSEIISHFRPGFSSSGCNSLSVSARHGSSVTDWTVYACHCVSKSSWRSSVRHNQQLGCTTLQTVNLRHPCVQCRWSSLLECLI